MRRVDARHCVATSFFLICGFQNRTMRTSLLTLCAAALLSTAAVAQCDGNRYFNQVFNDYTVTSNIQYGANLDLNGGNVNLLLDVYRPFGDTEVARPLVIMVHGGSFIGGSKIGADVVSLAADLTKMGYVVASINYRLGLPFSLDLEQAAFQAVIRGYHDAKAAVRFFRKDVAENGNSYLIDPDHIYMAGVSAGGFVALHCGYLDQASEIPAVVDQSLPGLGGGLEGTSGNEGYSSAIAGVVNIAGALGDADWMQAGDIPVLSFHGDEDGTVPYGTAMLQLFGLVDVTVVDGSASVHERADEVGVTNCFVPHFGADHVPHVGNAMYYDTTRAITANFLGHLVCPQEPLSCEYREVTLNTPEQIALDFEVYPNPARAYVTLANLPQGVKRLQLFDLRGQRVIDRQTTAVTETLQLSDFAKGAYMLRIISGAVTETRRIIIAD